MSVSTKKDALKPVSKQTNVASKVPNGGKKMQKIADTHFLSLYKQKVPRKTECDVGKIGSQIADGGYGIVYNVVYKDTEHAIKIFYIEGSKNEIQASGRELRTANALSSIGVGPEVYDYGFLTCEEIVVQGYMLMEKYAHDLASDTFDALDIYDKILILKESAVQLLKIHSLGMAHNDVKPNNIMFKLDKSERVSKVAVIDFGFTREVNKDYGSLKGVVFTPPDIYSLDYEKKISYVLTDSYQMALVIWFVFVGEWPFKRVVGNNDVCPVKGTYETYDDFMKAAETETVKNIFKEKILGCKGMDSKSKKVKNYVVHTLLEIVITNMARVPADRSSMQIIFEKLNSLILYLSE
jgi:serine/threonine protein kinase